MRAQLSQQIAERRRDHYSQYDDEGRKLFEPRLLKTATARPEAEAQSVDEHLYRDAFLRRDRLESVSMPCSCTEHD